MGNVIHIEGDVIHTFADKYDFEEGKPSAGEPLTMLRHGAAKEYNTHAEWAQKVEGTVSILDMPHSRKLYDPQIKWIDVDTSLPSP